MTSPKPILAAARLSVLKKPVRCERRAAPRRTHGATGRLLSADFAQRPDRCSIGANGWSAPNAAAREIDMVVTGTERR